MRDGGCVPQGETWDLERWESEDSFRDGRGGGKVKLG